VANQCGRRSQAPTGLAATNGNDGLAGLWRTPKLENSPSATGVSAQLHSPTQACTDAILTPFICSAMVKI